MDAADKVALFEQYDVAKKDLEVALAEEVSASRKVQETRQRLSNLQKSIDNIVAAVKANPPWDTHWHNQRSNDVET